MKALFLLLFITSHSNATNLEINKEHSKLTFSIDYMTMIKVEGQFKDFNAFFDFDPNTDVISNITAKVISSSVDTNDAKRDFHLKTMDFLFASKYPEMTFTSIGSYPLPLNKFVAVSGDLQIRDVKKRVEAKIKYKGLMKDPWGKDSQFFEFFLEVNRKDFGMNWNKAMDEGGYLVGDVIDTQIVIQAQRTGDKTSFSTHMIPSAALSKKDKP